MGLSSRERHALDSIEGALAGSDPRLAAMLTAFTRLSAGERMPELERIPAGRRHPHHGERRTGWQRAGLVICLLISIALIAAAAASRGSQHGCRVPLARICSPRFPVHVPPPAT